MFFSLTCASYEMKKDTDYRNELKTLIVKMSYHGLNLHHFVLRVIVQESFHPFLWSPTKKNNFHTYYFFPVTYAPPPNAL